MCSFQAFRLNLGLDVQYLLLSVSSCSLLSMEMTLHSTSTIQNWNRELQKFP